MKYGEKWPIYAKQWDGMRINASRVSEFNAIADRLLKNKTRYQSVEFRTDVPWWLIAVLHLRESDANFGTYLGNGQSLNRKTTIIPKGRGPFSSWEAGALDALHYDNLDDVKDWRLEKALWYAERFNGMGYENRGLPSPYVWGGTNQQRAGKFVADGKWNGKVWDVQPGVAPIIKLLLEKTNTDVKRED